MTLSLGYVGTRGMRLPYDVDMNQPVPNATRTYTILNAAGAVDAGKGNAGTVTVPFIPVGTARPSPNDGNVLVGFSGLNSWYHAGAFSIRKPFSKGFEVLANYTFAKALDRSQAQGGPSVQNTGGGTFQGTNIILDPFNLKGVYGNGINLTREYGRSDLDIRSRFVGTAVYRPIFHVGFNHYLDYAANGWELSGTYTAQSGTPLSTLMNATLPTGIYAGLDGGATGEAVTLNNSSGAGRVPFLARNNTIYAGIHNMDVRAGRDFKIHSGLSLTLAAEAFNLANHRLITGTGAVASSGYQYVSPGLKSTGGITCAAANTAPCIVPILGPAQSATPDTTTPFGTPTSTSGTLYGARQMQFIAKINF